MDASCKYVGCEKCKLLRPFKYAMCPQSSQLNPFDMTVNASSMLGYGQYANQRELRNMVTPEANKVRRPKNQMEELNEYLGRQRAQRRRQQ